MDQFVAHSSNVLPGDVSEFGPEHIGDMLCGFTYDFNLANHSVLNQRVLVKGRFIYALQVCFNLGDSAQNVLEIDSSSFINYPRVTLDSIPEIGADCSFCQQVNFLAKSRGELSLQAYKGK